MLCFWFLILLSLLRVDYMVQVWYSRSRVNKRRGFLIHIGVWVIRLLYRFPSPRITPSIVEANLRITDDLDRLSGLRGLSNYASPWDLLLLYRTLKADEVGEKHGFVLTEADNLHRRFLFCMGAALAIFLLGIQSFIRLILLILGDFFRESVIASWNQNLPLRSYPWLVVITIVGLWASVKLYEVAIRMLELEGCLTASLAHSGSE